MQPAHRKTGRTTRLPGPRLPGPGLLGCVLPAALLLLSLAGCHAQQPWPLWEAYTNRFLDPGGRIIDRSAPGVQHDRTTSEGQAYALFFALVDDDRAHFAQILDWTQANLAGGDLTVRLPAWDWGRGPAGQWKILDDNPASDADLWLAYTLIEAGRLWHDERYAKLGESVAARIAREEVVLIPNAGTTLAPGPHGFHPTETSYVVNPSYLPLPLLTGMAHADPHGPWASMLGSLPVFLDGQSEHGFAMDWVTASGNGVHASGPPVEPSSGAREPQAAGSFDAIRVYLWLGLADPQTPGLRNLLQQLGGMAGYLKSAPIPPLEVDSSGTILHTEAPVGFSAAVAPYLNAVGMRQQARAQTDRLTATQDAASGLYGRNGDYYDQNLVLFSTAFFDGRYRFDRDGRLHVKWK